jgi:DNA-binding beta-propeller fold protein YncE
MKMEHTALPRSGALIAGLLAISGLMAGAAAHDGDDSILHGLKHISVLGTTVPANGDVNPYGMAQVKYSVGNLKSGHILVSNFNNSSNAQGTGTTIVDMAPDGSQSLFAALDATKLPGNCPGGLGLTTALVVLNEGWVIVGSLPTSDGTSATMRAGCLIVLDSTGKPVETFYGTLINGPWDMTAVERDGEAKLFVTNVLYGTVAAKGQVVNQGTVVRVDLKLSANAIPALESLTLIGSGFSERTDPAALVLGPTGVALSGQCSAGDEDCARRLLLYVADTLNDRITVITRPLERRSADGPGTTLSAGGSLNAPLGLVVAETNGHLLTVNGADGFITEISPEGVQVAKTLLDGTGGPPPGNGALFGLVFDPAHGVYFVDDASNTLNLLH